MFLSYCKTFSFSVTPANLSIVPALISGNGDFAGNGPSVQLELRLISDGSKLIANYYMDAEQTDANGKAVEGGTHAQARSETAVWFAPSGILISNILIERDSSHSYRDSNQTLDVLVPIQGPIAEFRVMGDSSGTDVGSGTSAIAVFRTFDVELQQTENCEKP